MVQGSEALAGSVTSGAISYAYFHTPDPTGSTKVLAWSTAVSSVALLTSAGLAFDNADSMDSGTDLRNITIQRPRSSNISTPTGGGSPTSTSPPPLPSPSDLSKAVQLKLGEAKEQLSQIESSLKADGIEDPKDFMDHPEKYISPEELEKFNQEKEKMTEELNTPMDENKAIQTLMANYDGERSISSEGFSSQGGVFAPNFSSLDMNSFLGSFALDGMKNSAPGYYGNVSLKVLKPENKKSLFERVSLKLKHMI